MESANSKADILWEEKTHMVWLHLTMSVECLNEPFHIRLELLINVITVLLVQNLRQLVPKVESNLSYLCGKGQG